jgi:sulfur carrier protein
LKLLINGECVTVPTTVLTIKEIIEHYKIINPIVIVEHNNLIIEKNAHADTKVKDGDKIELIQFVGGG